MIRARNSRDIVIRRRPLLGRMVPALLAAVALVVAPHSAPAQQPPLKVGVLYGFSQVGGELGKDFDAVVTIFQKKYGTVAGGRTVVFIKRDEGGISPETSKRLAQELIVGEHVDLLAGLLYTPNAVAAGEISTAAKMPTFVMNATTSGILAKNPYMSRYSMSQTQVTTPLAKYAYKAGARNVYVAFQDYGPGIDSGTTFENAFSAEGGKVAGEIRMPLNATDFTPYLQRIKDAKPDALYVYLNANGTTATDGVPQLRPTLPRNDRARRAR
jgi:branched-chain amino acid transport system substrate-binding protein